MDRTLWCRRRSDAAGAVAPGAWRTDSRGVVWVNGEVPKATGFALEKTKYTAERWGELFAKHAARTGVPWHWLVGIATHESFGDPNAYNPETTESEDRGSVGLFQLYIGGGAGRGYTRAQLQDPDTNTRVAADLTAGNIKRYGLDLPKIAAAHNSGGARNVPGADWGLSGGPGYITSVVAKSNAASDLNPNLGSDSGSVFFPVMLMAALGSGGAWYFWGRK